MYTDSHCHLNFPELLQRLPEIRAAMADAWVTRALCICTTMEEFDNVHRLAMGYDNFWATVGVHPDNEGIHEPTLDVAFAKKRIRKFLWRSARKFPVSLTRTGLLSHYGFAIKINTHTYLLWNPDVDRGTHRWTSYKCSYSHNLDLYLWRVARDYRCDLFVPT